ncbi:MAG: hybrid sensor histidine kinase/response regulator [Nibricoccus sp.]
MFKEAVSSATSVDTIEKPLVLIVDDEYGPRESIAYTLSSEFDVVTAERPSEGIKRIQERAFSVVLLDIRMPEMDGIRALQAIREHDRDVSVVMLTGYGTLQTAQQSMVHGANQYLRKPPDIAELMDAVRKQAQAAGERRHQARLNRDMESMNSALKREIVEKDPHIWQARAAVELVHDLANPLTVMIGYASLLVQEAKKAARRDPEQAEKLRSYAEVVSRASEYCHHLADNWKQTTRKATEFTDVDLVGLVREVKEVIFFNNAIIQFSGMNQAVIRGSQFELTRVFQNLLKNALEAAATKVAVSFAQAGEKLEICVTDNGAGMDSDTAHKALKGGFTTKTHGTGLGLGICRHLLGAHGATLTLESEPKRGTTMRIVFPLARK